MGDTEFAQKTKILAAFVDDDDGTAHINLVPMDAARALDPLLDAFQLLRLDERGLLTAEVNLAIHGFIELKAIWNLIGERAFRLGGDEVLDASPALCTGVQVVRFPSPA